MTGRAAQKAESIKLVALDVDGVMTDGTLFYRAISEPETKPFNIKDGLGIKLLQRCDIDVAIITGRSSQALERRAGELGITTVIQGREDKGSALEELMKAKGLSASEVAYMGDDLPDLGALRLVGWPPAPMTRLRLFVSVQNGSHRYRAGRAPFGHWPILFCSLRVFCLT